MKQIWFFIIKKVCVLFLLSGICSFSQTNTNVSSAKIINTFPHTESNLDSSLGGSASGTNGSCSPILCCNVLFYRVEIPDNGDLTVVNDNFLPLTGSILAYTPDVPSPTSNSELTFVVDSGNFCSLRDTLTLTGLTANSVYYLLLFNHNQQIGMGQPSNFNFSFTPDGTLGVEEYEKQRVTESLFPNPSSNFILVSGLTKTENYSIYNTVGTEIHKYRKSQCSVAVDSD